ncbi:MAG: CHAT domain-containing protein [Burkholderiales bacterium]|nr:MAG: CHAT domain-containing protein [Burkholderiales bacterium]
MEPTPQLKSPSKPSLPGFDPSPLFSGGPVLRPGEANLIVGGSVRQVLGRMAACILNFYEPGGLRYIGGVTVLAPPRSVWDYSDEEVHQMLLQGLEDMRGKAMPPEQVPAYLAQVVIHRAESLVAGDVATAIAAAGERQLILVPAANKYTDPAVKLERIVGQSVSKLMEDVWVPHLARLASDCIAAAKPLGSVIVMSVTDDPLVKRESFDALSSVDLLFPMVLEFEEEPDYRKLLVEQAPAWVALAVSGRAKEAYQQIAAAAVDEDTKRQVTLQVASRAGDRETVVAILEEYLKVIDDTSEVPLARLGRFAHLHGQEQAAHKFLDAAVDKLSDQMWLETALMTVAAMEAADLVDRCWARLNALFPHSPMLAENVELRLLRMCDSGPAPSGPALSRAGFQEFHTHFADTLAPGSKVDYVALAAEAAQRWPDKQPLANLCVALHALGHRDLPAAVGPAVEAAKSKEHEPYAVRILLGALRRMFLLEYRSAEDVQVQKLALFHILDFLGRNPDEATLRASLVSALSVETAGGVGLPILASFALDVIAQGVKPATPLERPAPCGEAEFKAFFEPAIKWMSQQTVIEAGVTRLPSEIVGSNAAGHISFMSHMLRHAARTFDSDDDLTAFERFAFTICLLHPYAPQYSSDLNALRLLAAKRWLHGHPQRARDIGEQMLALARDAPTRRRLAWASYADVFQRTGSHIDALIGLSCVALTDAEVLPEDMYQEAYTLLRVARDLHLFDVARSALQACRRLADMLNVGELGQLRLEGVEIGLDVAQHHSLTPAQLLALVERARNHCERVMATPDELYPAAANFMQIAGTAERNGLQVPAPAIAMREDLGRRVGTDTGTFLRAISAPVPELKDVVWLHNRLESARNSEDTPADQTAVVVAAHRLLLKREPEMAPQDAAAAIELLSDRGLELFGLAQPLTADWPAWFIRNLSQAGVGVVMLAIDGDSEVIAVIAENGQLRVERPARKQQTFLARLNTWSADYPYRYGSITREEGNGEFYASMGEFELPMPASENLLVIAQPRLQQLPINLYLENGQFAGEYKAIGMAPSLTWLDNARQHRAVSSGKRHGWISCSPEAEGYRALDMVFARLEPYFQQHGFAIDTSGRIPADVRGASIAVVAAHGQLTTDKRYIHSIADEEDLNESALSLARALAKVELVILFVCSGGRVDPHPMVNTTVSLPKMLLDRGCRTVIASPWPLDVTVTANWLERFLERWDAGDTALEANFKANDYVKQRLGPEPGLCLAMTVYGDVLLTR